MILLTTMSVDSIRVMTVQTFKSEMVRQSWRDRLDDVFRGAAIIIERYSKPIAVLISHDEYQRFKGLEAALLAESREIEARNDRDGTWISGEEMDRRMAAHGVVVD